MRRIFLTIVAMMMISGYALHGQVIVGNYNIQYVIVAPSGACAQQAPMQLVVTTGALYSCQSGTWGLVSNAGGGAVTSFTGDGTILSNSGSTGAVTATLANTPTGTGGVVLANSPSLVTPALGTPASGTITNLTGTCTACTANSATTATTATTATNIGGGATGSAPYQSSAATTAFVASPTTSGHSYVLAWLPAGSALAPVAQETSTAGGFNGLQVNETSNLFTSGLFTGYSRIASRSAAASGNIQLGNSTGDQGVMDYSDGGNTVFTIKNTFNSASAVTNIDDGAGAHVIQAFGNGHVGTNGSGDCGQGLCINSLGQGAASKTGGTCAMSTSTSCTITIATTYTTPVCIATQQSATLTGGAVGCTVSGTTVTITSAVANSETWGALVFGNPN